MPRSLRSILVLLVGGGVAFLALDRIVHQPDFSFPKDFIEYWSSGRLNARGENPYDGEKLFTEQLAAQPERAQAVMMWNPPPSLAVYMPIGLLPARWASLIWQGVQLAAIMLACHLLWQVYGVRVPGRAGSTGDAESDRGPWYAAGSGLVCVGTWWVIGYGQNTGFLALGLAGFLYYTHKGKPLAAGACAALTALKPHLLAGFGVLYIADSLSRRGRVALAAGVGVVGAALAVAVAANPAVIGQFLSAVREPGPQAVPLHAWMLPVPSYWLREWIDYDRFWIQFVPCAIACAVLVVWRLRAGRDWDWVRAMPLVVAVSVLTTPYGGWIFDLPVLLVPVVWCTARLAPTPARLFIFFMAQAAVVAMSFAFPSALHNYFWVAPASLGLCLLGFWRAPAVATVSELAPAPA